MAGEQTPGAPVALTPEIMDYLGREAQDVAFAAGEAVVHRGDPGRAFWAVLEGTVEVRLTGEDGMHLPLARLGPGATFGEMALVTGEPVSADVVALTPVRLLRYPGERFAGALGECGPLRTLVMARMAANLRGTSTDVWNFFQQARAMNVLMDPQRQVGPIVAESGLMKPVRSRVAARAPEEGPLLVSGEPGTGKLFIAAKLHDAGRAVGAPFIAVDCRTLVPSDALRFLLGSETALDPGGQEDAGTLRRYGALHLAHGGTLVLRHAENLSAPVQQALARYARLRAAGRLEYPATRLIATSTREPSSFARAVVPELAAEFAGADIVLPRLLDRRRDIVLLARHFLVECTGPGTARAARTLSLQAEHVLLSQRYAHRNAAELREAIEMAAVIADEPQIQAEHIFTGPKGEGTVQELDLTSHPVVRRLLAPRVLGTLRAVVFAFFAAIVAASLLRSGTAAGVAANALTWGLWEPALFVVFLFVGRVWCTVCPLSTAGRLAARLGSCGRPPGAWLKNHSGWFIISGFFLVIWSEHVFGMTEHPRAAAVLLLSLFAAAIASALIWRREAWCRYLCPLGNLGAIYALPAVLTVRANPNVCATMCTTHECFKGTGTQPGCPVFHHPLYASEAHDCKQCYQCLRVCPHGSARLFLRLPFQSVWAQPDVGGALVPFALFLFFFAPAMLASQGATWAASVPGFTGTALLALLATIVVRPRLPRLLANGGDPEPTLSTRVAFSLLVLAWGPAMAYQLGHVGVLKTLHLHAGPQSLVGGLLPEAGLSLLLITQTAAVLFAALFAVLCLLGIRGRLRRDREAFSQTGWRLLLGLCVVYAAAMLAFLSGAGR